jgi:hypothetical protein
MNRTSRLGQDCLKAKSLVGDAVEVIEKPLYNGDQLWGAILCAAPRHFLYPNSICIVMNFG